MTDLWTSLIPLALGSALVPVQIVITVLLLRSAGRASAAAWVAGMTTVRLVQGVVFGLVLGTADADGATGPGRVASLLLLVVAVIFYAGALKKLLSQPDEDAPAPRWMAALDGVTPGRAYLFGVGILLVGAKFWVFTLGAIAAIEAASLSTASGTMAFVVFVVVAVSTHLSLVGLAYLAPDRASVVLERVGTFLETNDRPIMIGVGLVFGTWFLVKALGGLGVI